MGFEPYQLRQTAADESPATIHAGHWTAVIGSDDGQARAADSLLANIFAAMGISARHWQRGNSTSRLPARRDCNWLVFGTQPDPALSGCRVAAPRLNQLLEDPAAKRALWRELRRACRHTSV